MSAESLDKSLDQLLREYLERLPREPDPEADAAEFTRLSYLAHGHSKGWKFNREEIHERGQHARREDRCT